MKEQVLKKLEEKHISSGGHNGWYLAMLIYELKSDYPTVRQAVSEIHKEGLLEVRDGQKGHLLMYKPPKK